MNVVLEALRNETQALHQALEDTSTMRAATAQLGDAQAHGDYLIALALGVRPLVQALGQVPGHAAPTLLPDAAAWDELDADLAALGRHRPDAALAAVPDTSADGAWGRLYVVRGAEAGVAVLARRLGLVDSKHRLPMRFASQLARRRHEWPALCSTLASLPQSVAPHAAAAARRDFEFVLQAIIGWEQQRMRPMVA